MLILATNAGKGHASRFQWYLLKDTVVSNNGVEVDYKQFHQQVSRDSARLAIAQKRAGQSVRFDF